MMKTGPFTIPWHDDHGAYVSVWFFFSVSQHSSSRRCDASSFFLGRVCYLSLLAAYVGSLSLCAPLGDLVHIGIFHLCDVSIFCVQQVMSSSGCRRRK